jgi:hypothetical protein
VAGLANNALNGDFNCDKACDGGAIGQMIDGMRGVSPGVVTAASNPNLGGNQGRGTQLPQPSAGRVVKGDTPIAEGLRSVLSSPGTWPPIKASAI